MASSSSSSASSPSDPNSNSNTDGTLPSLINPFVFDSDSLGILSSPLIIPPWLYTYWLLHWESCEILTFDLSHPSVHQLLQNYFSALLTTPNGKVNLFSLIRIATVSIQIWREKFPHSRHVNQSLISQMTIIRLFLQFLLDNNNYKEFEEYMRDITRRGNQVDYSQMQKDKETMFSYKDNESSQQIISDNLPSLAHHNFYLTIKDHLDHMNPESKSYSPSAMSDESHDDILTQFIEELLLFILQLPTIDIQSEGVDGEDNNNGNGNGVGGMAVGPTTLTLQGEVFGIWFTLMSSMYHPLHISRGVSNNNGQYIIHGDPLTSRLWSICAPHGKSYSVKLIEKLLSLFVEHRYLHSQYVEKRKEEEKQKGKGEGGNGVGIVVKLGNLLTNIMLTPIKLLQYYFTPSNFYPISDRSALLLLLLIYSPIPEKFAQGGGNNAKEYYENHIFLSAFRSFGRGVENGKGGNSVFFEDLLHTIFIGLSNYAHYPTTLSASSSSASASLPPPLSKDPSSHHLRNEYLLTLLHTLLVYNESFAYFFFHTESNYPIIGELLNILYSIVNQYSDIFIPSVHTALLILNTIQWNIYDIDQIIPLPTAPLHHVFTYHPTDHSNSVFMNMIDGIIRVASIGLLRMTGSGQQEGVENILHTVESVKEFVSHKQIIVYCILYQMQWNYNIGYRMNKYKYGYAEHQNKYSYQLGINNMKYMISVVENMVYNELYIATSSQTSPCNFFNKTLDTQLLNMIILYGEDYIQQSLILLGMEGEERDGGKGMKCREVNGYSNHQNTSEINKEEVKYHIILLRYILKLLLLLIKSFILFDDQCKGNHKKIIIALQTNGKGGKILKNIEKMIRETREYKRRNGWNGSGRGDDTDSDEQRGNVTENHLNRIVSEIDEKELLTIVASAGEKDGNLLRDTMGDWFFTIETEGECCRNGLYGMRREGREEGKGQEEKHSSPSSSLSLPILFTHFDRSSHLSSIYEMSSSKFRLMPNYKALAENDVIAMRKEQNPTEMTMPYFNDIVEMEEEEMKKWRMEEAKERLMEAATAMASAGGEEMKR